MIVKIILSFVGGLIIGYVLESVYRLVEYKKLIKPALVNYQMYGLTAAFLCGLYWFNLPFILEILLIIIFTTGLEFVVGYSLLNFKKVRLWDYSGEPLNYKGIICPRFSFYWLAVALLYYYLVTPSIVNLGL